MSPADWSALAFIVLSSDTELDTFDLKEYSASEEALLRLLPVVKASNQVNLSCCDLSQDICGPLSSVLSSSSLTLLDLSNNNLRDSGVKLLCSGLKSTPCRLETLRLSGCLVSEEGGASLASALSSAHSHLRELDLSYNHLGPSAELLTALQEDPHCPLDTLRLEPAGERWMTPGPRKYYCPLTLDQNTVHRGLRLSEDNRRVTTVWEDQKYPDHQDRFRDQPQVLCSTGLTGRCYWEVDWRGRCVEIAVSYRGIRRTGDRQDCEFGMNSQSWSMRFEDGQYRFYHNDRDKSDQITPLSRAIEWTRFLPLGGHSGQVGVFLDSEAGCLSFYEVLFDGELSLLHTFTSTFTQPLFPGFRLWYFDSLVSLVKVETVQSS